MIAIVDSNPLFPQCSSSNVQPLVIAAHPQEPNQFALGLSDGAVHVFEPLESEGKWGVPPPVENGSASSVSASPSVGASGSEQPQRWSNSCQWQALLHAWLLAHLKFRYPLHHFVLLFFKLHFWYIIWLLFSCLFLIHIWFLCCAVCGWWHVIYSRTLQNM